MKGHIADSRVGLTLHGSRGAYSDFETLRRLVREAAIAGGLGSADPSVPLADIVSPGATVLLKPNWVLDYNKSGATMDCMVTHPMFILAVLAEVVAARAGKVTIADAPIQNADFERLAPPAWRAQAVSVAGSVPCEILDFRNTIATRGDSQMRTRSGLRDASRFVEFNLGVDSLLEPISSNENRFRNTNYDPDEMAKVQAPGVHRFLLCKEPFEADVILNLPKLKTHGKGGVTAALKNLVGMNGDKNYLPHHRVGGSAVGGDCYEGLKPFKRVAETLLDTANRRINRRGYVAAAWCSELANRVHGGDLEGKWWGNDTTWRMVLDLNRILLYGDTRGAMHDVQQRRVFSITDGLVAGQRNGPLAPEPIDLGAVSFAASSAHADAAHLALMRFVPELIPLVREAFAPMRYPLTHAALRDTRIWFGGVEYDLDAAADELGRDFRAADGWAGHVERRLYAEAPAAGAGSTREPVALQGKTRQ
jgi:uncharacterized protein (DUF362 family)